MPSDRRRSRSPDDKDSRRSKSKRDYKDVEYDDRDEERVDLEREGIDKIAEDDYFLKSAEFRRWLREEKRKYLDEMPSEDAHRYFGKFVKAWNKGKLDLKFYETPSSVPASAQTSYKWSFASKSDRSLSEARKMVEAATNLDKASPSTTPGRLLGPSIGPSIGPSLTPSTSRGGSSSHDRQYEREMEREAYKSQAKAVRREAKELADPKEMGRAGQIEKRRETNAENKKWREKDMDAGMELDESTLMGSKGRDDFKAQVEARDRRIAQQAERKEEQRRSALGAGAGHMAAKNQATMDMFKAMAARNFGAGGA